MGRPRGGGEFEWEDQEVVENWSEGTKRMWGI